MATAKEFAQKYIDVDATVFRTQIFFREIEAMTGEVRASTTAGTANSSVLNSTIYDSDFDVTILATTGAIWINIDAVATTSCHKLHEGDVLNARIEDYISTISTSTSAMYEAIIWADDNV